MLLYVGSFFKTEEKDIICIVEYVIYKIKVYNVIVT